MTKLSSEATGFGYLCSCAFQTYSPKVAQNLIRQLLTLFQGKGTLTGAQLKSLCELDSRILQYFSKKLNVNIQATKASVLSKRLKTLNTKLFCSTLLGFACHIYSADLKSQQSLDVSQNTLEQLNSIATQTTEIRHELATFLKHFAELQNAVEIFDALTSQISQLTDKLPQHDTTITSNTSEATASTSAFQQLQTELEMLRSQHEELGEFLQEAIAAPIEAIYTIAVNETLSEETLDTEDADDDTLQVDLESGLGGVAVSENNATLEAELSSIEAYDELYRNSQHDATDVASLDSSDTFEDVEESYAEDHDAPTISLQETDYTELSDTESLVDEDNTSTENSDLPSTNEPDDFQVTEYSDSEDDATSVAETALSRNAAEINENDTDNTNTTPTADSEVKSL